MGERKLTMFELHFDGPIRLGPSFGSDPEPDAADDATAAGDEPPADVDADADGGPPVKGAIFGVVALVLLAVAARVLLGGDDEDELDDVEMVEIDDTPEGLDVDDGTV